MHKRLCAGFLSIFILICFSLKSEASLSNIWTHFSVECPKSESACAEIAANCDNGELVLGQHLRIEYTRQSKYKINRRHDKRQRERRMCGICRQNDTLNKRIKFNEAMNGFAFECILSVAIDFWRRLIKYAIRRSFNYNTQFTVRIQ